MADDNKDIRVANATTTVTKTSLSDFLAPKEAPDASTDESTADDADSTANNVHDDSESTVVGEEASKDGSSTIGDADPEYDVKGKKVKLKDLINSYETREEISKRFNDAGKEKQRIQAERERLQKEREEISFINEKFEEIQECVLKGDSLGALQIALTMAAGAANGEAPTGLKDIIKQTVTVAENFHSMTPEEQELFLREEEVKFKERAADKKRKKLEAKDAERALKAFYDDILEKNSVTDAELDQVYEDISKVPEYKAKLDAIKTPEERISHCVAWVIGKRLTNTIVEGIKKVDPALAEDSSFRLALLEHVDPRCTVDDVAAIVKHYKAPVASNGSSAKVDSEASQKDVAPKTTTPTRAPTGKPKAEEKAQPIRSFADIIAKYDSR